MKKTYQTPSFMSEKVFLPEVLNTSGNFTQEYEDDFFSEGGIG